MNPVSSDRLADLNKRYDAHEPHEIIHALINEEFPGRIALVSSFGAESAVLLHMLSQVNPTTPVIFLDTGKLFGETKRYRDKLVECLGLKRVKSITPDPDASAVRDHHGILWSQNPNACCALRKVEPLEKALQSYEAWFTGRKSFQSSSRATLSVFEAEGTKFKINPLAHWTKNDIDTYFEDNDLPRHPLEADGYLSIGCMPCTDRVGPGEDMRAGRWRGSEKTECGIHMPAGQMLSKANV